MKAIRRKITNAVVAAVLLSQGAAWGSSGLHRGTNAQGMTQLAFAVQAGKFYRFELTNPLDPEAILDVFARPTSSQPGGPLIGESRYLGPGPGTLARVEFAATSTATVDVLVRGAPGSGVGTDVLKFSVFSSAGGALLGQGTVDVSYEEGFAADEVPGGLRAGSEVRTVEQYLGCDDTLLMVLSNGVPIAFDDDSGVASMSYVRLSQACASSSCGVLVGRRRSRTGPASLVDALQRERPRNPKGYVPSNGLTGTAIVFDEDAHVADSDQDGLGNALEQALGTCSIAPCSCTNPPCGSDPKDTDGDGIPDFAEVIGLNNSVRKLTSMRRFPFYGADPLKRDLFLEIDALPACADSESTCTELAKQANTYSTADVLALTQTTTGVPTRFAPEFALHVDYVQSTPPFVQASDWGGANLIPDSLTDFDAGWTNEDAQPCQGLSPDRAGYFHHNISTTDPGGATDSARGGGTMPCTRNGIEHNPGGKADAPGLLHEIGHQFGLQHEGRTGSGYSNAKPHYRSVMNYAYTYEPHVASFSHLAFGGLTLNPFGVDESAGLGTTDTKVMSDMTSHFLRRTGGAGAPATWIDWNMDGLVSPPGTPAPLQYSDTPALFSSRRSQVRLLQNVHRPAVADLGDGSVALAALARVVGIRGVAVLKGDLHTCSQQYTEEAPCATWSSGRFLWTTDGVADLAPALARNLIVYADSTRHLRYFKGPGTTTPLLGAVAGGSLGGPAVDGDLAAIDDGSGVVRVYAPVQGQLRRWEWNVASQQWTFISTPEVWSDGETIQSTLGIGLTSGYQSDIASASVYAVIAVANSTVPNQIDMARLNSQVVSGTVRSDSWLRLPPQIWSSAGPAIAFSGKPALAYLPSDPSAPAVGRFYIAYPQDDGGGHAVLLTRLSAGNHFPVTGSQAPQDLRFARGVHFEGQESDFPNGVSMVYAAGGIRAAAEQRTVDRESNVHNDVGFYPTADGIINQNQQDTDDYEIIYQNMSCSLKNACQTGVTCYGGILATQCGQYSGCCPI